MRRPLRRRKRTLSPELATSEKCQRRKSSRSFWQLSFWSGVVAIDFNDRAISQFINAKSMRRWRRCSRKANPEALDKAGNAAHVHVERVARAERREPLRIRGAADQLRS
jgi:hypothetical protein